MKRRTTIGLLLFLFALQACLAEEFSVMTYNLRGYTLDDRDGDGRKNDPKPDVECRAVARIVGETHPDILAIQEIGVTIQLNAFMAWLKTEGLEYPHVELL